MELLRDIVEGRDYGQICSQTGQDGDRRANENAGNSRILKREKQL